MKKTFLTAAIIALSSSLSAININANGSLKQKLLAEGLSDDCSNCISNILSNAQPTASLASCLTFQPKGNPPYTELKDRSGCYAATSQYDNYFAAIETVPKNCKNSCTPKPSLKKR